MNWHHGPPPKRKLRAPWWGYIMFGLRFLKGCFIAIMALAVYLGHKFDVVLFLHCPVIVPLAGLGYATAATAFARGAGDSQERQGPRKSVTS